MANWTPDSFIGRLFKTIGNYVPPAPGVKSPALWGSKAHLVALFGANAEVATQNKNFTFRYKSPAHWVEIFRTYYGPVLKTFAALDPAKQSPALDQTVLVGHSMGGLISKLQTVDSGDRFWATMSDKPFNDLQADPDIREELAETYFFDPNTSIRRIITIGTPHRGSDFSNDVTKWFGSKLINVPAKMLHGRHQLATRNPGYFRPHAPLEITNSIDSLSPKSPILPVLLEAPQGPWVRHHNIVGEAPHEGITSTVSAWLACWQRWARQRSSSLVDVTRPL